jgi:hypothetical protein
MIDLEAEYVNFAEVQDYLRDIGLWARDAAATPFKV